MPWWARSTHKHLQRSPSTHTGGPLLQQNKNKMCPKKICPEKKNPQNGLFSDWRRLCFIVFLVTGWRTKNHFLSRQKKENRDKSAKRIIFRLKTALFYGLFGNGLTDRKPFSVATEKRRKKKHAVEDVVKKNHGFDQNNFRADDVEEIFFFLLSKIKNRNIELFFLIFYLPLYHFLHIFLLNVTIFFLIVQMSKRPL
jgi:hypothetical protein